MMLEGSLITVIGNNPANWGQRGQNLTWDPDYRVFIHIEEYVFHGTIPWEERPMVAIEYWYYYVYNDYWPPGGIGDHDHDFELHTIVFLDQDSESVLKLGYSHHISIDYYDWSVADWIGTHPVAYVAKGSHAADEDRDIPWEGPPAPGWEGDGRLLSPEDFKNVSCCTRVRVATTPLTTAKSSTTIVGTATTSGGAIPSPGTGGQGNFPV